MSWRFHARTPPEVRLSTVDTASYERCTLRDLSAGSPFLRGWRSYPHQDVGVANVVASAVLKRSRQLSTQGCR
eukprot:1312282-Prymnesium_polylepis.1